MTRRVSVHVLIQRPAIPIPPSPPCYGRTEQAMPTERSRETAFIFLGHNPTSM
jgi:hypothetical protein